jgi:hypothetical protein
MSQLYHGPDTLANFRPLPRAAGQSPSTFVGCLLPPAVAAYTKARQRRVPRAAWTKPAPADLTAPRKLIVQIHGFARRRNMAWLFERMIELAAWVAFILGISFLISAVYFFAQGVMLWWSGNSAEAPDVLIQSSVSAGSFVLSALAVGALACIDHYVFDLPESAARK